MDPMGYCILFDIMGFPQPLLHTMCLYFKININTVYIIIYIHVCRIVYLYHYQLITSQHLNISSAQAHKTPSKTKPELMASER